MSCCSNFYSLGGIFENIPNRMLIHFYICQHVASQVALVVKKPPAKVGDERDMGSIPGSGRSPGGGHGDPLQYSCLENPVDRGAWWATVHASSPVLGHLCSTSVSMHLTTLGTSFERNHTVFVLLCLAYFVSHNVLKVHVVVYVRLAFL